MRIVVIGGGAAGMMFSTQYKKSRPEDEVIVFEKTEFVSWAGCPTPYYISNELPLSKVTGSPKETFIKRGIDVRTNHLVESIDFENKVLLVNGEEISYDKLVLAFGGKSTLNIEKSKYFHLSHAVDAIRIKEYLEKNNPKKALIVGMGFIGLEMVESFLNNGLSVTVVERANDIFLNIPEEFRNILKERIEKENVNILLNTSISEFNDDNVVLENGENIDFDIALISTGITANVGLLKDKIELVNGKILVNDNFETNIENVYAIGDCIISKNIVSEEYVHAPFGDLANKHGLLLSKYLTDKKYIFKGVTGSYATSFFELKLAGTGLSLEKAKSLGMNAKVVSMDVLTKNSGFEDSKIGKAQIVYDEDKNIVLGATILGYEAVAQFIDQISIVINFKIPIEEFIGIDFAYSPTNASVWNPLLVLYRKVIK